MGLPKVPYFCETIPVIAAQSSARTGPACIPSCRLGPIVTLQSTSPASRGCRPDSRSRVQEDASRIWQSEARERDVLGVCSRYGVGGVTGIPVWCRCGQGSDQPAGCGIPPCCDHPKCRAVLGHGAPLGFGTRRPRTRYFWQGSTNSTSQALDLSVVILAKAEVRFFRPRTWTSQHDTPTYTHPPCPPTHQHTNSCSKPTPQGTHNLPGLSLIPASLSVSSPYARFAQASRGKPWFRDTSPAQYESPLPTIRQPHKR